MNWKKLFSDMNYKERKAASEALGLNSDKAVPSSTEPDNPLEQARAQAEKYAAERNQATRRAHFLSEETMKTDLQKGAAVPPSSDDPLARAQAQAERYAAQRNRG
jgi:hypothetical protein